MSMKPYQLFVLFFLVNVSASKTQDVSKKPSSNPLLIQLVNSVNKLIYQHAADIREVQKDIKKLDEDIKQLKNKQGSSKSCPQRFTVRYGTSCYHFVPGHADWMTAYLKCKTVGAELVSIETREENAFLKNHIRKSQHLTNGDLWISGTDQAEEGIWFWAGSGKFIDYSDWHPGEPGTPRLHENCLFLYKPTGWDWHDAPCSWKRGYICEMSI